jgi:hypothetical protein
MAEHNTGEDAMTDDLPWEVQLLLMMWGADRTDCEFYVDALIERAAEGSMSKAEIARFRDAMAQVRNEHERQYELMKLIIDGPKVEFENGQWRIT